MKRILVTGATGNIGKGLNEIYFRLWLKAKNDQIKPIASTISWLPSYRLREVDLMLPQMFTGHNSSWLRKFTPIYPAYF